MIPASLSSPAPAYVELTVPLINGQTECVRVRRLTLGQLVKYLELSKYEHYLIEYLCDKPSGWSDNLGDDAYVVILGAGEALNLSRANAQAERIAARLGAVTPKLGDAQTVLSSQVAGYQN